MGGVAIGSPVSAANTNSAFLEKNADDATIGRVGLNNTLTESGPSIQNIQRELNGEATFTGRTPNDPYTNTPAWINNDAGTTGDTLKDRADALTQKFNASYGHQHSGAAGDGAPIQAPNIQAVQLKGVLIAATDLTSVTGSSVNVSTILSTQTPSTGVLVKGLVVTAPYNLVPIRNQSGDLIETSGGAVIYGRLTYVSSVWTLSFYADISGTETAQSLSAQYVKWYYQQLINPISDSGFTYNDQLVVPSENATADVVYATASIAGKILLSSTSPSDVGTAAAIGSSVQAALADHVHLGLRSVTPQGGTAIFGDLALNVGANLTLTQSGNTVTLNTNGTTIGAQENLGTGNGTVTTFGPLSYTPINAAGILAMLDGSVQDPTLWSLSGSSIVWGTAPAAGQKVTVFYLTQGTVTTPPAPTGTVHVEYYTLTSTNISTKILTLNNTPASPSNVLVDIIGGTGQIFNVDFTIVSNQFRWSGYALDGVLIAGNIIRIWYQS